MRLAGSDFCDLQPVDDWPDKQVRYAMMSCSAVLPAWGEILKKGVCLGSQQRRNLGLLPNGFSGAGRRGAGTDPAEVGS